MLHVWKIESHQRTIQGWILGQVDPGATPEQPLETSRLRLLPWEPFGNPLGTLWEPFEETVLITAPTLACKLIISSPNPWIKDVRPPVVFLYPSPPLLFSFPPAQAVPLSHYEHTQTFTILQKQKIEIYEIIIKDRITRYNCKKLKNLYIVSNVLRTKTITNCKY